MLKLAPTKDLGYAVVDHQREMRNGCPEVIYGEGKTKEQILGIMKNMLENGTENILATRVNDEKYSYILNEIPDAKYNKDAKTVIVERNPLVKTGGIVLVATGGTSDIPVAEEAPQDLHHHARKAAGDADQSDLVKVDAGGKAIRLLLLQVDNGVGGGTAEEALALGALLPLPQAGGELVGLVGGPLMGLTQAGGGILQHLHLLGHVAAQGGLLLRREALLVGQLFVILLILNFQRLFRTQDVLTAIQ